MNEKHSRETADAAETLWKLLGSPEWKLYEIAEVIQAAEERGRRRGVEERDELRECLKLTRPVFALVSFDTAELARIDAALGKE